jgi:hypothetical protein
MPIPAFLAPLLSGGLSLLGNAALAKGKDWLERETGVDLSKATLSTEDLAKLRQYEMDHEEALIRLRQEDDRLQKEIDEMYLVDTQNARNMQIAALAQEDIFSKRFLYYYATFWSFAAVIYIGLITFVNIPPSNIRFADIILGFLLGTVIGSIIQFFFGSSKSSQNKDAIIHQTISKVTGDG